MEKTALFRTKGIASRTPRSSWGLAGIQKLNHRTVWGLLVCATVIVWLGGCGPTSSSSQAELEAFNRAGPFEPDPDLVGMLMAASSQGPYQVIAGDLLEFDMPTVLRHLSLDASTESIQPNRRRVDPDGKVILPIIGELKVAGLDISSIEKMVTERLYPEYLRQKPSIVVQIVEYKTARISINGAVVRPGNYRLRNDQMTLIAAIMEAGGIVAEGASMIYIRSSNRDDREPKKIEMVGLNIPEKDIRLNNGDTVVVDPSEPQVITVIGLVKKPGMYPCSPKNRYNVMDALAFAGGVKEIASPDYVWVYRQDGEGKIVSVTLKLGNPSAVGGSKLYLKPGDVVAVEETGATRTRVFLSSILRIGLGVNAGAGVSAGQ